MNKLMSFLLILVLFSTLFADDLFTKSKCQISYEYVQKDKVFFYDYYGNSDNHQSKFPIYLKEFLFASGTSVGCLGTGIGLGFLLALTVPEESWEGFGEGLGYVFFLSGLSAILQPAVAAWGTCGAAKEVDPGGSYGITSLGAYSGSILVFGIGYWIYKKEGSFSGQTMLGLMLASTLCSSIGAVIGYNLSVPKGEEGYGFLHQHFDLPSFSMKTEKTQEGKTITALDFRLIKARF